MKRTLVFIILLATAIPCFLSAQSAAESAQYSNVIKMLRANDMPGAVKSLNLLNAKYSHGRLAVDASLAMIGRSTDYFESIVKLKKLLEDHPEYPEPEKIIYEVAKLYYLHNNYTESLASFLSIATNFKKSRLRPAAYYWAGNICFFRQEYERAEYYFWESIKSKTYDSYQPLSALRLGDMAYEQKKYYSAITNYKRAIKNYVDNEVQLEGNYYLAESYAQVRNYKEAEAYYGAVIKDYPDSELARQASMKLKYVSKKKNPVLLKEDVRKKTATNEKKAGAMFFFVQVGTYKDARSANNLRLQLKKDGFPVAFKVEETKTGYVYRVRVGKYFKEEQADLVQNQMKEKYKLEATVIEDTE